MSVPRKLIVCSCFGRSICATPMAELLIASGPDSENVVAQAVAEALAVVTAEAVTAEAVSVAVHARAGNFLA